MEDLIYEAVESSVMEYIADDVRLSECAKAVTQAVRKVIENQVNSVSRVSTPFTTVELFPPMPMSGSPVSDCTECGGYVKMLQQHKHTAWHNKVADL